MTNKWRRAIASICIVSYLLASCTTLQEARVPENATQARSAVSVGDNAVIHTKSGAKKAFRITAIEADAIVGKNVRIAYSEIESLSIKRLSTTRVVTITLLVAVAIVLVATNKAGHSLGDAVTVH